MTLGGFRFQPPWWAWLVYVLVLALLLNLGAWQLRRAHAKEAMLAVDVVAAKASARDLVDYLWAAGDARALYGEAVQVSGEFMAGRSLLQDSQVRQGQVGYHVWTPLRTRVGLVLVNRGWVPAGGDRQILPDIDTPGGIITLKGQWRGLPRPGMRLGEEICETETWPRVVQYPRREALGCILQAPVRDGILLLAPDQPHGYARDWHAEIMPPAKHYGYALQWFALAFALTVIFIVMNSRRVQAASPVE